MTRKHYQVSDPELWDELAKTIRPLHKRARKDAPSPKPIAPSVPAAPPALKVLRPKSPEPPPLSGFDRRTGQKLMRGNADIEARLDLHGTGIELARVRLLDFLIRSKARGLRLVLVITGKGASPYTRHTLHGAQHFHAPEREGRLRRLVPEWLGEREFRALVSGFQPAHPKHGGGGAFYVKLRRDREAER